jgi:hypothetical protein
MRITRHRRRQFLFESAWRAADAIAISRRETARRQRRTASPKRERTDSKLVRVRESGVNPAFKGVQ